MTLSDGRRPILRRHVLLSVRCRKTTDFILGDNLPETVFLRMVRRAFVHDDCAAIAKRTIDDVAMAGDPTDIRGTPEDVVFLNIEDPFMSQ